MSIASSASCFGTTGPKKSLGHLSQQALGHQMTENFLAHVSSENRNLEGDDEHSYYHVIRVVIVSFMKGAPPSVAVEYGRRAIPSHVRPSFQEMEKTVKNKGEVPAAEAAPAA